MKWDNQMMLIYLLYLHTYRQVHIGDETGYLLECERLSNRTNQATGENNHGSAVDTAFKKFEALHNHPDTQRSGFSASKAMVEFYNAVFNEGYLGERTWDSEQDLQDLQRILNIYPNTND